MVKRLSTTSPLALLEPEKDLALPYLLHGFLHPCILPLPNFIYGCKFVVPLIESFLYPGFVNSKVEWLFWHCVGHNFAKHSSSICTSHWQKLMELIASEQLSINFPYFLLRVP